MPRLYRATSRLDKERVEDKEVVSIDNNNFSIEAKPPAGQFSGEIGTAKAPAENDDSLPAGSRLHGPPS